MKQKICVFGGHPAWLKAIRPLIKEATFFGDADIRNLNVIRNADQIWIQTNAISHSLFSKIVKTVRVCKIPLFYFHFASAKRCADQLNTVKGYKN